MEDKTAIKRLQEKMKWSDGADLETYLHARDAVATLAKVREWLASVEREYGDDGGAMADESQLAALHKLIEVK